MRYHLFGASLHCCALCSVKLLVPKSERQDCNNGTVMAPDRTLIKACGCSAHPCQKFFNPDCIKSQQGFLRLGNSNLKVKWNHLEGPSWDFTLSNFKLYRKPIKREQNLSVILLYKVKGAWLFENVQKP